MIVCSACDMDLCWLCERGCECGHANEDRSDTWVGGRRRTSPTWLAMVSDAIPAAVPLPGGARTSDADSGRDVTAHRDDEIEQRRAA